MIMMSGNCFVKDRPAFVVDSRIGCVNRMTLVTYSPHAISAVMYRQLI